MPARSTEWIDLDMDDLEALRQRARRGPLSDEDDAKFAAVLETLGFLQQELGKKSASIARLRKLIFGSSSEKTDKVLKRDEAQKDGQSTAAEGGEADAESASSADEDDDSDTKNGKKKRPGHGRNGAAEYEGAKRIKTKHGSLNPKDPCPKVNCEGRVYELAEPAVLVRVWGSAPLDAEICECQRLRCNLCGEVFTAAAPAEFGEEKYDATAAAMIALLKYGSGLPFNRLKGLQGSLKIPLPASTQWDIVRDAAEKIEVVLKELIRQAAQGEVLHNDDTWMKILELMGEGARQRVLEADDATAERTGVFSSGIVSVLGAHRIVLFFTGTRHAGENLEAVLKRRAADLATPIQMCDGLAASTAGEFEAIVANCLAHARRKFVDVVDSFPEECEYVLTTLREVYKNDARAKKDGLSAQERLELHKEASAPLMAELHDWLERQFDEKLVEENSSLGAAISYMKKRWKKLTLFLREPGAPLDNNLVEWILKKAILHRKTALFYKTQRGARVGDLFMSLIATCQLAEVNPYDYLTELIRHSGDLAARPQQWLPWNYRETIERSAEG